MEKIPCALLLNDIHAGKDNLHEFLVNWEEMIEVCEKFGVVDVIIGGDLWQSRSSQDLRTLLTVRDALLTAVNDRGLAITIASGNHDLVNQEEDRGYNHIFSAYPYVDVIDDYSALSLAPGVTLYTMSYYPETGSFEQRIKDLSSVLEEGKNILYCHEGIRGGLAQPREDELPASLFKAFDLVLVGHYHDRKKIKGTNIEYIGASRQHNFGEDEEKGYTILYSDGSTEFVKNQANTRYKTIEASYQDLPALEERLGKIKEDPRCKVKVKIKCASEQASAVDKQKIADLGASKVEICTEDPEVRKNEAQELSKKFDKDDLKEEYSAFCIERGLGDIETGLNYLERIYNVCGI